MQSKVGEGPGANDERHLEALPQLTRPTAHLGHVYSQHQRLIARPLGALDEFHGALAIAAEIELEPGAAFGPLPHVFQRRRGNRGNPDRHPFPRGQFSQPAVGIGPGQVAHAHGRDAKRQLGLGAKEACSEGAVPHVLQHARTQSDGAQGLPVGFITPASARRAINVVKDKPGQHAARRIARVVGVNDGPPQHSSKP